MVTVTVNAEHEYPVIIGERLLGELPGLIGDPCRVLLLAPHALATTAEAVREDLLEQGYETFIAEVPDAEEAKTSQVAAFCWEILGQANFTRSDVIVGIGGGATTDLAGFVAATWLRGVRVIQVPTTLLAMVDAAVGGKTGINTKEGKNLVGAFHSPVGVLADLRTLDTLPKNDLIAGLAEVIKCGFIADEKILDLIEIHPEESLDPRSPVLAELIERAVAVKARIVGEDLKESHLREVLNYGHTLAHAIERTERYQWRHGAAVSVGMMYAAELSRLAGKLGEDDVARHRDILTRVGLPVTYRGDRWSQLLETMKRDKKTRGDLLRFVVLDEIGKPSRLEGPDPTFLVAAYTEISAAAPGGNTVML